MAQFDLGGFQPGSIRFETVPDVSRKLDTILQLLQGPNGLAALNSAINRQNQISVSTESNFGDSSLFPKQKWGEIGMHTKFGSAYVDPLTAMQNGTMSWNENCSNCHVSTQIEPNLLPTQTIVPTLAPQQSTSVSQPDVDQAMSKTNHLLEQILRRVSAPRVESKMTTPSLNNGPDMTNALFTINEEISGIRQLLAVQPEPSGRVTGAMMTSNSDEIIGRLDQLQSSLDNYNDLLQQIYDTISQLVGQANDNTTMINDLRTNNSALRQTLGEAHSLLIQNINHRGSDIQQLMDENTLLKEHVQKLVRTIEGEPRKKK